MIVKTIQQRINLKIWQGYAILSQSAVDHGPSEYKINLKQPVKAAKRKN